MHLVEATSLGGTRIACMRRGRSVLQRWSGHRLGLSASYTLFEFCPGREFRAWNAQNAKIPKHTNGNNSTAKKVYGAERDVEDPAGKALLPFRNCGLAARQAEEALQWRGHAPVAQRGWWSAFVFVAFDRFLETLFPHLVVTYAIVQPSPEIHRRGRQSDALVRSRA